MEAFEIEMNLEEDQVEAVPEEEATGIQMSIELGMQAQEADDADEEEDEEKDEAEDEVDPKQTSVKPQLMPSTVGLVSQSHTEQAEDEATDRLLQDDIDKLFALLEEAQMQSVTLDTFCQSKAHQRHSLNTLKKSRYQVANQLSDLYTRSQRSHHQVLSRLQEDAQDELHLYYYRTWCYQLLCMRLSALCQVDKARYKPQLQQAQHSLARLELARKQQSKKRWQGIFVVTSTLLETGSVIVAAVASDNPTTRIIVGGILSFFSAAVSTGMSYWGYRSTERDREQHQSFKSQTTQEEALEDSVERQQKDRWIEEATQILKTQLVVSQAKSRELMDRLVKLQTATVDYERERAKALQSRLDEIQNNLQETLVKLGISEHERQRLLTQFEQKTGFLKEDLKKKEAEWKNTHLKLEEELKEMEETNKTFKMESQVNAQKATLTMERLEKEVRDLDQSVKASQARYDALLKEKAALESGFEVVIDHGQVRNSRFQALLDQLHQRQQAVSVYEQLFQSDSDSKQSDSDTSELEEKDGKEEALKETSEENSDQDVETELKLIKDPVASQMFNDTQFPETLPKKYKEQHKDEAQLLEAMQQAIETPLLQYLSKKTVSQRLDKKLEAVIRTGDLMKLEPYLADPRLKQHILEKVNNPDWKKKMVLGEELMGFCELVWDEDQKQEVVKIDFEKQVRNIEEMAKAIKDNAIWQKKQELSTHGEWIDDEKRNLLLECFLGTLRWINAVNVEFLKCVKFLERRKWDVEGMQDLINGSEMINVIGTEHKGLENWEKVNIRLLSLINEVQEQNVRAKLISVNNNSETEIVENIKKFWEKSEVILQTLMIIHDKKIRVRKHMAYTEKDIMRILEWDPYRRSDVNRSIWEIYKELNSRNNRVASEDLKVIKRIAAIAHTSQSSEKPIPHPAKPQPAPKQ